jgi:hypothetical protein
VGRRLKGHLFEVATAAAWPLVGLAYLFSAGAAAHSAVGQQAHPLDTVWSIFYVVGGPAVLVGIAAREHRSALRWRVAGLVMLSSGLLMQALAVAVYNPDPRIGTLLAYAAACGLRALACAREMRTHA